MNEKELAAIRFVFGWANLKTKLHRPKDMTDVEWMYFLQKLGFEKGCNLMVDQGFPGIEEPMKVERSGILEEIDRR